MKDEIQAAVLFLVRFIEKKETFPRDKLDTFKSQLIDLLTERFQNHWFPDCPAKGQGYRCIRVNELHPVDLVLQKAATLAGLTYNDLQLPIELTVWVDPNEVCCRFGESEGSYCTLATFSDKENHLIMSEQIDRSVSPASDSSSNGSVEIVHHKSMVLNVHALSDATRGSQKKYRNRNDILAIGNTYSSPHKPTVLVQQTRLEYEAPWRSANYLIPRYSLGNTGTGYNFQPKTYNRVPQYHNVLTV